MKEFCRANPVVNLIYYAFVIGFSMFFMHPLCLAISFCGAFCYGAVLGGKKYLKAFLWILPLAILCGAINPLFNHRGMTILGYFPGGNPFTLESAVYGIFSAVMLITVVSFFYAFTKIMTSDRFVYLFGKVIPSLSLVLSMVLRFVPKFTRELKEFAKVQEGIGQKPRGGVLKKLKFYLKVFYAQVGFSLESSIETSDSMRARGYGKPGRTAYAIYKFTKKDAVYLCLCILLGGFVISGAVTDSLYACYYPVIFFETVGLYRITLFAAYFILCFMPLIFGIKEEIKWKKLKSKI